MQLLYTTHYGTHVHDIQVRVIHRNVTAYSSPGQDIDYVEYFAGMGNITRVMLSASYKAVRFDLLDNSQPKSRRSNFMNLTHCSGFAFLVKLCSECLMFLWFVSLFGIDPPYICEPVF